MNDNMIGLFESSTDVGDVGMNGSVTLDGSAYTITGSGYNMWFAEDAFHFLWRKLDGDLALSAAIEFPGEGTDPHRKACLIIRQSLAADSAYAGIAVHGDGLTSLQYRDQTGGPTQEVQSNIVGGARVGVVRVGDYVSATIDGAPTGGSVRLDLTEPFYVGLGVCSHVRGLSEVAVFADVSIGQIVATGALVSTLETISIATTDRRTVRVFDGHIEAPNWTSDDRLVYNSAGKLYSIPVSGGASSVIDSGFADRCNNDHGLSPDGAQIAISDQSQGDGGSLIYTMPIGGGKPTRVTDDSPSYWHGWSPDGQTLAFCGEREGSFGIFTIPAGGGPETRLTTAIGLDDGPEYSSDGEWIYFNSDRTGLMQIFKMRVDGTQVQPVTDDGWANWFPHVSPDGRWMAFLSYGPEVSGHPANKDVQLRLLDLRNRTFSTLCKLFGGQGTINVPSWSPDSTQLAFVSYSYV